MTFDVEAHREHLRNFEAKRAEQIRDAAARRARGEKPKPTPLQRENRTRELDRLRSIVSADLRAHPLRRLRLAEDLTMAELAVKAKVSRRAIQAIETRERLPRATTMKRLSKALGVSVAEISE